METATAEGTGGAEAAERLRDFLRAGGGDVDGVVEFARSRCLRFRVVTNPKDYACRACFVPVPSSCFCLSVRDSFSYQLFARGTLAENEAIFTTAVPVVKLFLLDLGGKSLPVLGPVRLRLVNSQNVMEAIHEFKVMFL